MGKSLRERKTDFDGSNWCDRSATALLDPRSSRVRATLGLFDPIQATQPVHTVLRILLHSRSQLGLVQVEIVHGADAQNTCPRKLGADAVHEGAARGTEVVGHCVV